MRPARLALLILLLPLPLGSCGTGTGFDGRLCQNGRHQVAIQLGVVPDGAGGEARNIPPCNSTITVLAGLPETQTAAIIVHELWHAAGYSGIHNGEGCYTASTVDRRLPSAPCAVELDQMLAIGGVFEVTVLSPELEGPTRDAVDFWNLWVQREMFLYE